MSGSAECLGPAGVHGPRPHYDYRRPGRVEHSETSSVAGGNRGGGGLQKAGNSSRAPALVVGARRDCEKLEEPWPLIHEDLSSSILKASKSLLLLNVLVGLLFGEFGDFIFFRASVFEVPQNSRLFRSCIRRPSALYRKVGL